MLTLALALAALAAPPQGAGASLEAWMRDLEQKTQARRTAAAALWSEQAGAYLAGDAERAAALVAAAPEIQEPVLLTLRKNLAKDSIEALAPPLLHLLGRVMNEAGAEELFALWPELPPSSQPAAVRAALSRGGAALWADGLALAGGAPGPIRQAAAQALLLHGPPEEAARLGAILSAAEGDLGSLSATLRALSERTLPDAFLLPAPLFELRDPGFQRDLAGFLAAHPQEDAEPFLVGAALDPARPKQERVLYLAAFEAGAKRFRWKTGEKACEEYLKDVPRTEATEEVAWTLFRLGSRNGKRYLLQELEQEARDNPDSYRDQIALARRQVDVGDHADAFKGFKNVIEMLAGTAFERYISAADYVWAARAAAGSRHQKEAGQWLEASGLNSVELAEYRGMPEFEPYLDKQPFKRLFGVAD